MAKVTGIGGVFIKSKGKGSQLAEWYKTNLGLTLESWGGSILKWPDDTAADGGLTVWSSADHDTKWFSLIGSVHLRRIVSRHTLSEPRQPLAA